LNDLFSQLKPQSNLVLRSVCLMKREMPALMRGVLALWCRSLSLFGPVANVEISASLLRDGEGADSQNVNGPTVRCHDAYETVAQPAVEELVRGEVGI
jgi:hypothetical protein